ncbi:hypothetical protein EV207_10559 [Scopulibacillus darangshiensis]|uniref:Cof subfamily protein (Haloacid dehalogenase superfamily)/HAD superfamily hydrolase (TIGR01484 family) n=1 Tax=Scopulibacillus darangshiensis TaxID=442528 RepID=A0A4R2P6K4_9BACL|nr:Cof-type HAD-IIB family hydrolase [Scopulibacillus darangshiensis]TCP30530.1 hypothetical protein EV207_10559 [Scopulibacillus darangshiensis]
MTKQKIVFFDIDGTLLDHEKQIPDSTRQAIKHLQENGVITAIATGRAPFMFEEIRKELNINTFVSFNGQYVVHDNNVVFKNPLSAEALVLLEEKATAAGHPMAFFSSESMASNRDGDPFIKTSFNDLKMNPPLFDMSFHNNNEIYQALLFCEANDEAEYLKLKSDFEYIRWHQYSTDVIPAGGSKALGIKQLLDSLKIDVRHTYAFGDALNDIQMLSFVNYGIAMGNALDETKNAARFITKHVDQDGIYHGLQEVGLLTGV